MGTKKYSVRENNLTKFVVELVALNEGLELALEGDNRAKKVFGEVKKYEDVLKKSSDLYKKLKKRSKNYNGPQIEDLVEKLSEKYESVKTQRKEKIDWV